MHILQRHILKVLTTRGKTRYKDLKPKEIDGNQFMYHLGVVTKKGFVEKIGLLYGLTTKGKMYADRTELNTFIPREQPKIVTMIYCVNKKGEILFFRRIKSPLRNRIHVPYGKLHMGESVCSAAERELEEKSGITADLRHVGEVYVRVHENNELIAHILHHIFLGKNPKGTLKGKVLAGISFWSRIDNIDKSEIIDGFFEIFEMIKKSKGKFFFEEFDIKLPKNNPYT